jgi:cytochrome c biogenesis protein CcmG, thiol:disulfide interchange protein DsbE
MAATTAGRSRTLLTGAALAALGIAGYWTYVRRHDQERERAFAPVFTLTTLDGAPLRLEALRGKVVLIDFWATWCGPCRDEIPELGELNRIYGPRGVQVVGISMDDDAAPVRAFYRELHMNYPVALGDAALAQRFGGVLGLPVKFLIDRKGRIAGRHDGAMDSATLARELSTLLSE